jgi:hypothetical protein
MGTVATFHPVPVVTRAGRPPRYQPDYEQFIRISALLVLAKGGQHAIDGTGGAGDTQVRVTIAASVSIERTGTELINYRIYIWD